MLLDNANSIYINNKEAKEIWYGGKQIWTLPSVPTGNPFDLYTPTEIQAMIQNGTVEQYFKIGDILTVSGTNTTNYTGLDELQYMIVDFEYNSLPTMVLMCITDYGNVSWSSSSTSSLKSYTSSQPYSKANGLFNALKDNGLYDIAVTRTVEYVSGNTSSTSRNTSFVIPSLTEVLGSGHGRSYEEFGTQLRYYKEGGDFVFGNYVWTRERDKTYTGQINVFSSLKKYASRSAITTTYKLNTTALIFLG